MGIGKVFAPTKVKVVIFVILALVLFALFPFRIFSCLSTPVIPNPPAPQPAICYAPMTMTSGAATTYTILGGFEMLIIFLVVPYLVACGIGAALHK